MNPARFQPHPEGGRFQEVFKSGAQVSTTHGLQRAALSHIYFSLDPGEVSRFHRVGSDEVWNLYQGQGLRLYSWQASWDEPICTTLSAESGEYQVRMTISDDHTKRVKFRTFTVR